MDLLASSYFSDEEMENQRKTMKDNDDQSSSDESIEITYNSIEEKKLREQEIECICLDDSDVDDTEVSNSTLPSKGNICSSGIQKEVSYSTLPSKGNICSSGIQKQLSYSTLPSKGNICSSGIQKEVSYSTLPSKGNVCSSGIQKEVSKKIDYMNLESSDTDEEQQHIQNRVSCLLSSAAILNDIECGPTKTIPEYQTAIASQSFTDGSPLWIKRSNSPALAIPQNDRNIWYEEYLANKKIKLEKPSTGNIVVNVNRVGGFDPRTRMYRKDIKIIAASKEKYVSCIPSILNQTISAHDRAMTSLSWCPLPYSHILISSSWDCTIKIWDIYPRIKPIQTLNFDSGVRAAKWSSDKEQIIAGGFGKKIHVIDALSGQQHMNYDVHNYVSSIAIHPSIDDFVLCGTKNVILGFDLRVNFKLPVRMFATNSAEVLDMVFLNSREFVCCTDSVSRDSANPSLMVWDFRSGARVSKQIFLERYTCPSLKVSPSRLNFIAQTSGNYIVKFSSQKPYKREKKPYVGHKVYGFGIDCDISPDNRYVASGDANGGVYFYNYADTRLMKKLILKSDVAMNKLQWHPVLPHVMAVASWDGQIHLLN